MRPEPPSRADFAVFRPIQTRWGDNDMYGHVNNVAYYAFFDTLVNAWLIEGGALRPLGGGPVGLVVATSCDFFESTGFPEPLEGGIAVERQGRTSVTYRLGIFREGADRAAAAGRFTHVYVDAETRSPVPLPEALTRLLSTLGSG